jgi:hypothetical protein
MKKPQNHKINKSVKIKKTNKIDKIGQHVCQILGNILDLPKTVVFIFCLSGQTRLYNTFIKSFDFLSIKLNHFFFIF